MLEKISTSVKDNRGTCSFYIRQDDWKDTLEFFLDKMKIDSTDSIIPGWYHNRRDYMGFLV
jgi:polyphosphate kinase